MYVTSLAIKGAKPLLTMRMRSRVLNVILRDFTILMKVNSVLLPDLIIWIRQCIQQRTEVTMHVGHYFLYIGLLDAGHVRIKKIKLTFMQKGLPI